MTLAGKLQGALFTECAEWVWEQLGDEGYQVAGEIIELILETERELAIQSRDLTYIAHTLADEFQVRGIAGNPSPIDGRLIRLVLDWEDTFLGFAGISREES